MKSLLDRILDGDNPDISSVPNLSNNTTDCTIPNGKVVSFHSPITLNVYDANGNHAGPDASGDIEDSIPGADYETIGDNKFVFLPDGQDYQVTGQATGVGTFDARIENVVDGEVSTTTNFNDIPITQNSQTEFTVGATVPTTIALDENGDGTFESSVSAPSVSAGLDESPNQPAANISVPAVSAQTILTPSTSSGSSNRAVVAKALATVLSPKNFPPATTTYYRVKTPIAVVATSSQNIVQKSSNVALAYQALTQSVKNIFVHVWMWIKRKF